MEIKKKTRSFRVSDTLWQMVESTAEEQNKKPSEIIIEALASHCGEIIRRDRKLSNQQIETILSKVASLENEAAQIKGVIYPYKTDESNLNQQPDGKSG